MNENGGKNNTILLTVIAIATLLVVVTGAIMTMPGLPKKPAAYNIDVDKNGNITGLF